MAKKGNNNKTSEGFFAKVYKIIKFIILLFAILYIGVIIGYSVIGDGKIMDAITLKSIKHIFDILFN